MKNSLYIEKDVLRDIKTKKRDQVVIFSYLDEKFLFGWTKFTELANCHVFQQKHITIGNKISNKVKTAMNEFKAYIAKNIDKLEHLNWPYKLKITNEKNTINVLNLSSDLV